MVIRWSGSWSGWRPLWVTGWNITPRTAGCLSPNSTIAPASCSLTLRSMAATRTTWRSASASRSSARSFVVEQRLAADDSVGRVGQAVELEVDQRSQGGELREPFRVVGDPHAVGVDHHVADVARLRRLDHLEQVRVDRRLAARELDDLRVALELDEAVEHPLDLGQGQVEAGAGVGEADRAIEVARAVDLDQGEAGVLAMLGADPAVERAALEDLGRDAGRRLAGLVEPGLLHVRLGVGVDQALEPAVVVAALAHVDLVVAEQDLRVDDRAALGADRARDFVEDLAVGSRLGVERRRHDRRGADWGGMLARKAPFWGWSGCASESARPRGPIMAGSAPRPP